jgi:deoxyribodipyrimidine photo-lyase
VDHNAAYHRAQDAIHACRQRPDVQAQADTVLERHGSRA